MRRVVTCVACQVREVAKESTGGNVAFEWAPGAFLALQQAAEAYLVDLFADAYVQARVQDPDTCAARWQRRHTAHSAAVGLPLV